LEPIPTSRPKGAKVATVGLALSAIAAAPGYKLDTRAREIRAAMQGIRRTYAEPQTQAEALKPAMARGVLATLGDGPVDRRDAALVALLLADFDDADDRQKHARKLTSGRASVRSPQ
jgi:hypothetical protein